MPLSSQRNHSKKVIVPRSVARDASLGILMLKRGFAGGTPTGWNRAKQLAHDGYVDIKTLATMRAWFARHGPDARTGGTSYPGYCAWLKDGKPLDRDFGKYRGAVSWLIWGGNAAYRWLKTKQIRELLNREFPNSRPATGHNNLERYLCT